MGYRSFLLAVWIWGTNQITPFLEAKTVFTWKLRFFFCLTQSLGDPLVYGLGWFLYLPITLLYSYRKREMYMCKSANLIQSASCDFPLQRRFPPFDIPFLIVSSLATVVPCQANQSTAPLFGSLLYLTGVSLLLSCLMDLITLKKSAIPWWVSIFSVWWKQYSCRLSTHFPSWLLIFASRLD